MIRNVTTPVPLRRVVPRLRNGDDLSLEEFEKRYNADPELKKAELIEGVVFMPSPVSYRRHGKPHTQIILWLGRYMEATPGVELGDNITLRLDRKNMPQPDVAMFVHPDWGGQVRIDEEGYVVGAPELVVEIAASSVSYDLHQKLKVYKRNGAREYIVWRVEDEAVDWFAFRKGTMAPLAIKDGTYRSKFFPGLWLEPRALIAGDFSRVASVAQTGLNSPEHQKFADKLQKKHG